MNWLDFLIIGIFCYNLAVGLFNGLLRSLFNLAAMIGAYLLTPLLKPVTIALIETLFFKGEHFLAVPLGISLAWTCIYLTISMVGVVVSKIVNKTPVVIFDRLAGFGFGFIISLGLVMLPLAAVEAIPMVRQLPAVEQTLKGSLILPVFKPAEGLIKNYLGPMVLKFWLTKEQAEIQKMTPKPSPKPSGKTVPHPTGKKPVANPR